MLKRALTRAGQVLLTFAGFALLNSVATDFQVETGVSILFPATGFGIVCVMFFGPIAAIGIIAATMVTPWAPENPPQVLFASGVVSSVEALIPWLVFKMRRDLRSDLRDMKSLLVFLVFGTIVNTGVSAIAGNLLVIEHSAGLHLVWHEVFVWWLADFTAALLIAMPVLAFSGALRRGGASEREPRTIVNTLQIVMAIILLGFAASFATRTYVLDRTEHSLSQERARLMLVANMVDGLVFAIVAVGSFTVLYRVSRPLRQIRGAIDRMRDGEPLKAARISSPYLEFRAIASALEETSRELHDREVALRLQTDRAVAASKHKSEFLAKMSHELRTPLNSIIGFSELLAEQEATIETPRRLAFLDNVTTSARHLLHLINDLLDIAKVESGKMKMHFENVDLRQAIANTVASTTPLFHRKKQELEVAMPPEPMMARADIGRVEQVLLNLLANANKFSGEGQRIQIRSEPEESAWRIDVIDHGIGISADDQKRIFDEFEQVHPRGPASAGTGLGLALAKRFVEMHGGEIGVESAPGAGARFSVRLPRV
jgi:signal transduction histidine kinase